MSSLPCSRRKSSVLTPISAANAEPETLWQRLQWHSSKGPLTPAISKRTPPHKQLPLIIQPPIGSSSYLSPANTKTHLPPEAAARHEWRLEAVRCSAMFGGEETPALVPATGASSLGSPCRSATLPLTITTGHAA